jgi:hypothetical protein
MSNKLRKADGWRVSRLTHREGREFIEQHHYARGAANTSTLATGLIAPNGHLVGVTLWMPPTAGVVGWARRNHSSVAPVMLSRMAILDDVPRNAASFLLSRAIRMLRPKGYDLAVTYADPLHGHSGHVYLAAGWKPAGMSRAAPTWTDAEGRQRSRKVGSRSLTVAEMVARGWTRQKGKPKPRYIRAI